MTLKRRGNHRGLCLWVMWTVNLSMLMP
uniref:Uncharacterized protein n=1 Tax=Arundo donax TaxID=35708 RepID=A0A0A9ECH0_ARUDO